MPQTTDQANRHIAKIIAIVVRNAMEDFHVRYLSDAQMRELNPIIRNGIYSALHTIEHREDSALNRYSFARLCSMIPDYWEEPELPPESLTREEKDELEEFCRKKEGHSAS